MNEITVKNNNNNNLSKRITKQKKKKDGERERRCEGREQRKKNEQQQQRKKKICVIKGKAKDHQKSHSRSLSLVLKMTAHSIENKYCFLLHLTLIKNNLSRMQRADVARLTYTNIHAHSEK